jgi:hypothetical protein
MAHKFCKVPSITVRYPLRMDIDLKIVLPIIVTEM